MQSTCITRRSLIVAIFVHPLLSQDKQPRVPNADTLTVGDFLWPKPPKGLIPYNSQPGDATARDRQAWEAQRRKYLAKLEGRPNPTMEEKERYRILSGLSYEEFLILYLEDEKPGSITPFGARARFGVGHVAIVDVRLGRPWIIEAMTTKGVRELTYDDWLKERPGEEVWLAGIRKATPSERERVVAVARAELTKPYDFWNFNLLDNTGFYCSKLAWFSVWKATGKALDAKATPERALWFSPKQMLRSELLQMRFQPSKNY